MATRNPDSTGSGIRLPFATSHAFLIGINAYQNGISTLTTAVKDAKDIAELLGVAHGYQVHTWFDATKAQLLQSFEKMKTVVKPNDRVLFYFAGHGIALDSEKDPEGFLVPADAQPGERETLVSMDVLRETLDALDCKHGLLVLDCCFAGAFKWSTGFRDVVFNLAEMMYEERFYRFVEHPAWQVITSSAHDQKAVDIIENQTLGMREAGKPAEDNFNSPFAKALKQAINLEGRADIVRGKRSDGVITASELYLYLRDIVESETTAQGKRQSPSIFNLSKHDKGEFIFLHPGHSFNLPKAPETNPYKGLNPYTQEDASFFFGREDAIKEMAEKLQHTSILVVSAPSGQGKSSTVRAGLFPYLKAHHGYEQFHSIRPGVQPDVELNKLPELDGSLKHILLIDQYEEVFTDAEYGEGHMLFEERMKQHLAEANESQMKIILTIRSDFEWQLKTSTFGKTFWEDVNVREFLYRLPPMGLEDLRQMTIKPVWVAAYDFESEEMVDHILEEINHAPGALPLLSFTLHQLYELRDRAKRLLTVDAYIHKLGGINGALSTHADNIFQSLPSDGHRTIMRYLMLRMVRLNDGSYSRRRVYLNHRGHSGSIPLNELDYPDHLDETVEEVLEALSDQQLLVRGRDETGDYVEPMHDSLINYWPKCLGWIQEFGRENLTLQRQLWQAVVENIYWDTNPKLLQVIESVMSGITQFLFQREKSQIFIDIQQVENELAGEDRKDFQRLIDKWSETGVIPNLDAFILSGASGKLLDIFLEKGEHWLNEEEVDFIKKSWNKRTEDILSLKQERDDAIKAKELAEAKTIEAEASVLAAKARQMENLDQTIALNLAFAGYKTHPSSETAAALSDIISNPENYFYSHSLVHAGSVYSVAFSPDGNFVLTGGTDNTARLWAARDDGEVKRGEELFVFNGYQDWVTAVDFSPDGNLILAGGRYGGVWLWTPEGDIMKMFEGHGNMVHSVSFSHDGKQILTGSHDRTARVWDLEGNEIYTYNRENSRVSSAVFSPDGKLILIGGVGNDALLWDIFPGEMREEDRAVLIFTGHSGEVEAAVFSPDGTQVLTGSDDHTAKLWIAQPDEYENQGTELQKFVGHTALLTSVAFSPDGKFILTGSQDKTVRLWEQGTDETYGVGIEIKVLRGHFERVSSVVFSPDGKFIVTGGWDNTAKIWSLEDNAFRGFMGHTDGICKALVSPDGKRLLTGSWDGTAKLWNFDGNEILTLRGHGAGINSIAFSPDGNYILTGSKDKTAKLWSIRPEENKGREVRTFTGHESDINSVAFSPDGKHILTGSEDNTAILWNAFPDGGGDQGVKMKTLAGHTGWVMAVAFSPDGQYVLTGSLDNTAKIWDIDPFLKNDLSSEKQDSYKGIQIIEGHTGGIPSVAFSPDGKHIFTGSYDDTAKLWDFSPDKWNEPINEIQTMLGKDHLFSSVTFSPNGNLVLTGSTDNIFKLWDAYGNEVQAFPAHWAVFSPDGQKILTVNQDGTARWRHNPLCGWDPSIYKLNEAERKQYKIEVEY